MDLAKHRRRKVPLLGMATARKPQNQPGPTKSPVKEPPRGGRDSSGIDIDDAQIQEPRDKVFDPDSPDVPLNDDDDEIGGEGDDLVRRLPDSRNH
jgi:hypothetical protein